MKIRTKLTLIFTCVTAFLILLLSLAIYYFSLLYTERAFYDQLKERLNITAQVYLKKDEVDARIYQEIREKFLRSLPEESEEVYSISKEPRLVDEPYTWHYPEEVYRQIMAHKYHQFTYGKMQAAGRLYSDNQGEFLIIVRAYDQFGNNKLHNLRNVLITGFLFSTVFVYVLGRFLAYHALKPIKAIVRQVKEISASSLDLRLHEGNGRDEISELSHTFNNMLDRLENAFEMQKTFITNASHELRNPLTAILGEVEITLNKSRSEREYVQSLQKVSIEAERLQSLTTSLLSLSKSGVKPKDLQVEPIRMDEFVWEVKTLIDQKNPSNGVVLEFPDLPEDADLLVLEANGMLLKTAFLNILENACKFSGNGKVQFQVQADRAGIRVSVTDGGVGIPEAELEHILQPFYRCSNARGFKGFGIGLALTHRIIKLNGGSLEIRSQLNKGTCVSVFFPGLPDNQRAAAPKLK
jgi:signal transduction histidine kinase